MEFELREAPHSFCIVIVRYVMTIKRQALSHTRMKAPKWKKKKKKTCDESFNVENACDCFIYFSMSFSVN